MNPNISRSGLAFIIFLLSACNSDSTVNNGESDPVLVEYPVVYIEREIDISTEDDDPENAQFSIGDPTRFNPGAALKIKKNAFAQSKADVISANLFPEFPEQKIDIRDLSVSPDGQEFLVSVRAPENEELDDDEQATWNIWRYRLSDKTFERVIIDEVTAEKGDDLMASYLPDGRIIFASNRQKLSRAILLDEGKPQYSSVNERSRTKAFNIHIMQNDGSAINQLSFNLSHDFYPLVMQDGHILYSRWDAMGGQHGYNLYRMRPDGTENTLVYGWHSHRFTETNISAETAESPDNVAPNYSIDFVKPQQLANGQIMLMLRSNETDIYQKRPVVIDIDTFIDYQQTVDVNSERGISSDNTVAMHDLFSEKSYNFINRLNLAGSVSALFPLPDDTQRYLMSLDLCRVIIDEKTKACGQLTKVQLDDENTMAAAPKFELWLFNQFEQTQSLVARTEAGKMIGEAVVMQSSQIPPLFIADKTLLDNASADPFASEQLDNMLYQQQAGAVHIRSVYDTDGQDTTPSGLMAFKDPSLTTAQQRPARFVRVVRGVPMPPRDVRAVKGSDFGRSNNQLMREILGYSVIQPDGSVKVKVPANIPFIINLLDENGQRIGGRHNQWLSVKAGETLQCHGCHEDNSELPHGRLLAQAPSINVGATSSTFINTRTDITAAFSQTMAQALAARDGINELTADLLYRDKWTDSDISAVNPDITISYDDLTTLAPNGSACFNNWTAFCRLQINYIEHIAPLWEVPRQVIDAETTEVIADNTCTVCHATTDSDGISQLPAAQLDLTNAQSPDQADHLISYRELMFNDVEQEIIEGLVLDKLIDVLDDEGKIVYEVDSEGELILDQDEQPISVKTTVAVRAILSTAGAQASGNFFDVMSNVTHQGMLAPVEQKLLSEWLDIGGQYYNTPFYTED